MFINFRIWLFFIVILTRVAILALIYPITFTSVARENVVKPIFTPYYNNTPNSSDSFTQNQ
jgi:hypothetical protein